MILIDTSVWVDHLRKSEPALQGLLLGGAVLVHPLVTGELAMGNLNRREVVLRDLRNQPQAVVARDSEVLQFVAYHSLFGLGIGYIDAHLLASTKMTHGALLWTRDRRLRDVAVQLSMAAVER
jgi:predicted nucleic acid-binding protein